MAEVGLQLGGYHFMTADNPVDQADFFLTQVVKKWPGDGEVSGYGPGGEPRLSAHRRDGRSVRQRTGEESRLYAYQLHERLRTGRSRHWLAEHRSFCMRFVAPKYGAQPTRTSLPAGYSNWLLWQCNDGTEGADVQPIQNAVGPIDRSWFNGTADQAMTLFAQGHF
jgi:hypothetical protein